MLSTKQDKRALRTKARLAEETGAVDFFAQLREAQVAGANQSLRGESGHAALDFFAERYVDLHDQLTMRMMRGEQLSPEEDAMLGALNAVLDEIGPEQPGLPDDINKLVSQVLKRFGSGAPGRKS